MSSPIRRADQVDPELMYAPPRARNQGQTMRNELLTSTGAHPEHLGSRPDSSDDRTMMQVQDLRNLDPEWIPKPPPADDRIGWRVMFRVAGVLFLAAATAWVGMSIPSVRNVVGTSFRGNVVSRNPEEQFLKAQLARRQADLSAKAGQESGNLKESKSRLEQLSAVAPTQSVPVATTRVAPRASDQVIRDFVIRQLDSEELASMRLHADHFIKSGDLSSARLLLERAAEAGDGNAALTLAGTFDPNVVKTLGFQEGAVDIEMARLWYERAERFGSAEARNRLQQLATASSHRIRPSKGDVYGICDEDCARRWCGQFLVT